MFAEYKLNDLWLGNLSNNNTFSWMKNLQKANTKMCKYRGKQDKTINSIKKLVKCNYPFLKTVEKVCLCYTMAGIVHVIGPNPWQSRKNQHFPRLRIKTWGRYQKERCEGAMLGQCHAPSGMPIVVAVSLELWFLWLFQATAEQKNQNFSRWIPILWVVPRCEGSNVGVDLPFLVAVSTNLKALWFSQH